MADISERVPDIGEADVGQALEDEKAKLRAMSDEELVSLFLSCADIADPRKAHVCFEALMARYGGLVNHVVRSSRFRFPAWDSADDIVSRAIFKIYRGLSKWRGEGKLSSFIARITTTEMIDTIRRVRRDKTWEPAPRREDDPDELSPIDVVASTDQSPEAIAADREQRRMVSRLLVDVCRDWKDSVIINEYIIGGVAAKDICDKYGISEDLTYQRARRLKTRLLKWLGDRGITSAEQWLTGGASAVSL
jgi:RNA polymerase sigma factor (sigma-70 family)